MQIEALELIKILKKRLYLKNMQENPEKWKKLHITYLDDEQLEEILTLLHSEGMYQIITELDVSHNQLTYLPESIGTLSKLMHLDVSHNQLKTLPKSLENLTLETCLVNNNTFKLKEPMKAKKQKNKEKYK